MFRAAVFCHDFGLSLVENVRKFSVQQESTAAAVQKSDSYAQLRVIADDYIFLCRIESAVAVAHLGIVILMTVLESQHDALFVDRSRGAYAVDVAYDLILHRCERLAEGLHYVYPVELGSLVGIHTLVNCFFHCRRYEILYGQRKSAVFALAAFAHGEQALLVHLTEMISSRILGKL